MRTFLLGIAAGAATVTGVRAVGRWLIEGARDVLDDIELDSALDWDGE